MIHPNTELRFVSADIGYGVFATEAIPKGTIVYVKDRLEIEFTESRFRKLDSAHREIVEKYSYRDHRGVRIVSWDHAKYVNHRCDCNSMSTGYGFEIALRDIEKDEEITDEYGLFNLPYSISVSCGCRSCRKLVTPTDLDTYGSLWDERVIAAVGHVSFVPQPLWGFMDAGTSLELQGFLSGVGEYKSVRSLKLEPRSRRRLPMRSRSRAESLVA